MDESLKTVCHGETVGSKVLGLVLVLGFNGMFGVKTPSMESLASKAWSTAEINAGLAHLIENMNADLPDDLDQLQDRSGCPQ